MKLGTDRKKLVMLGGLVVLGGYLVYSNVLSGPSAAPEPSRPARALQHTSAAGPIMGLASPDTASGTARRPRANSRANEEFRPSLKLKRAEDRVDPMTIDPTLRTDLLAKVQGVAMEGGARNLFKIGQPPAPPLPKEPIVSVVKPADAGPSNPGPPAPPPKPQAPPITLKYYGYSSARSDDNRKRAFFLDGEDILVAAEGDLVKKRYRVVRIGVNSVVMEDIQFKHEQTLPLQEEAQG